MSNQVILPKQFVDQIKSKNIVLFLGSGASYGAKHPSNEKMPLGQQLSDLIANEFLGEHYIGKPLSNVAEIAISEASLFKVQGYIYDLMNDFQPADFHLKIPTIAWHTVFTTNYDKIIERAYEQQQSKIQELVPLIRNTPVYQIKRTEKTLLYYKLHGCISLINDEELPLILTIEQYIDYQVGRERLFARLLELAYDFPILFVGYSLSDPNIRTILQKVDALKGSKPMSYIVSPTITDEEKRYWEGRKFTVFKMSFEDIINIIDGVLPQNERIDGSKLKKNDNPIFDRFKVSVESLRPTDTLLSFIKNDVEYVHANMQTPNTDAKSFYKGYFENWDPIVKNLDVRRYVLENVLFEVFLNEHEHSSTDTYLYLISGNAGSGKTVLHKRLAFEASAEIGRFCIYLKQFSLLSFEPLAELFNYVKERVYLFVDNIHEHERDVIKLLDKAQKIGLPITIIAAERTNIWNTECEQLSGYLDNNYVLKYLSDKEISELLILLEKHNSLGALKFKSEEERITSLREIVGRELLVALYEATSSKSFEEIIYDEYKKIGDPVAQSLYLTVSILHRIGAEARAGLISRVHGISFHKFKAELFKPLQYIVFDKYNPRINDYIYTTRHKQVAEIIFSTAIKGTQERFDEYIRIIENLNLDFDGDKVAYMAMTNARQLISIFPDPNMVYQIFAAAEEKVTERAKLLQQKAIYEMNAPNGSLALAERLLREANKESPDDYLIAHSLAELILNKAYNARYDKEFFMQIDDVIDRCATIITKFKNNVPPYHTILKASLARLKKILLTNDDAVIQKALRDIEKWFSAAKQVDKDDNFILDIESKFNEVINNRPNARELLERAFAKHKGSPFIVLRYVNFLMADSNLDEAIRVVKEALPLSPHDKDMNFKCGELLLQRSEKNNEEALHYFKRSYTVGDSRYQAQFWYFRTLYVSGSTKEAIEQFKKLGKVNVAPDIKHAPRGVIKTGDSFVDFQGEISDMYYNSGYIKRDKFGDLIYFPYSELNSSVKESRSIKHATFNLAFNYHGPIAINIRLSKRR